MFAFKSWIPRVVAVACAALLGALWLPGVAGAWAEGQQWAVVNRDGTLARSNGADAATHISTGTYEVAFGVDLTGCAFVATPGDPAQGEVGFPAVATVASVSAEANAVFVQTWDQTLGALDDVPFHLTTYCGRQANFVVVSGNGSLVRSSHVTSSKRIGTGNYAVRFDHNVSTCAFTASLGDTADGSIASPGEVTVAGVPGDKNGVVVRTMSRAGAATDFSFHLAVDCGKSPNLVAVVKGNSTIARGGKVVSSAHLFRGGYEIIFNRDVSGCAYTATIGEPGNQGAINEPVAITTATRENNVDGVFVLTFTTSGKAQNEPFHLIVDC